MPGQGRVRVRKSMLTFYSNRAGRGLSASRRKRLEHSRLELRKLHAKERSA
jgi:hypothetical protein